MVGCFETEMATLCVVRHMEPMEVPLGGPMLNPYECLLMTRTNIIRFVPCLKLKHVLQRSVYEPYIGCAAYR